MIPEDAIEQKPAIKKRILVGSLLSLAAMGTHWLPGRTIVTDQPESRQVAMVAPESTVTGSNTLLGDTVIDKTAALASTADMGQYHLDVDGTVDQAGLSQLLSSAAPVPGEVTVTDESNSIATASAVPEPGAAGILLLVAAPVLIRGKRRAVSRV